MKTALPRVLVATTAMLSFISFWRAAAIVLNDLASSAFYAGGIMEDAVGKAAPWFILGIMLFAYAVLQVYVESCSMFVRGGVYRVVKEAMGGTLAKFSVSALMFDYVLTGPISGVSAGQYLVGFLNNLLAHLHLPLTLPVNATAAVFAAGATIYFWWENVKGITESSEKALRIMQLTTIMVVVMLGWCFYTLSVRGFHLPPWPLPHNLNFNPETRGAAGVPDPLGLLRHHWAHTVGVIGIFIALGHSVLAMSGEESLAQVYREIEHPKLKNLEKAGLVIFIYSMLFTTLVSFFAFMIIPDSVRPQFSGNLIAGLARNVIGPQGLKVVFEGFVVLVGVLILSGAVNTAIVGSNGVLNRVSEDGVLTAWFRQPHHRFGTSHRIINMVAALQLLTILISRGNVIFLGNLYAFGVVWSFAMKGLAVLVLRYTEPGPREFRVPLNIRIGRTEIPIGLALITALLLVIAVVNLFTKPEATVSGVVFTLLLFGVFTASERINRRQGLTHRHELDQFNVEPGEDLSPTTVGVRADNLLVMVRDYNTLYPLAAVLDRVNTERQDVVSLHIRYLQRAGSGEHGLVPDQLFTATEQELFTRALNLSEKSGKSIHLAVVASNDVWDATMRSAQGLQSATVVLGLSPKLDAYEEARIAGLAWERLPAPRPQLSLEIHSPSGQEYVFYLGPHAPRLTAKEIDVLHRIWLHFSAELGGEELHHHDIVHFALNELEREIHNGNDASALERLRNHLHAIHSHRPPHM
jgi:amino acid transporter